MMIKKIFGSLFLLLSTPIFALSSANVNQTWFYPGKVIVLTLNADSGEAVFPVISNIAGYPVLNTNNSQRISIVNNRRTIKNSKSYAFKPLKSLQIPAYTLTVDGVKQTTQPIKITFKKPSKAKAGDDYILQIEMDRTTFFLGDTVNLNITFKAKKSLPLINQISLSTPDSKDLLFIKNNKVIRTPDENYHVQTLSYKVSANNFGTIHIPSLVATIGNQNNGIFSNFFDTRQRQNQKKVFSNALTLTVKPLPDALRIFGNFNFKAIVDKTQVKQGEAVNLTVSIVGKGNFEDIEAFKIEIDNTTIYSDDAVTSYKDWQQKFAIIGGQSFVIPSLKLNYFDKTTQTKKTINTQPINIQVDKASPVIATTETLVKPDNKTPVNNKLKYYYLLLGLVIGALISFLSIKLNNRQKPAKNQDLIKQIKSSKGDKALFDLLLPLNLSELDPILQQLEANLYKGETHKINKKAIMTLIQSGNF
ncbi:BatD family protein [Bathymodiolus heckerae thiotrophic gill symbiont]|uniref:BatD family protein n=1 Tax=Bathymodiolus heckerae thiotrophic gill symbiont TaxID=1052212 RepID=UPI001BB0F1AC|nr:BatD family protein [Bathymodiolus heckerae thiotrophic gill symbiont]